MHCLGCPFMAQVLSISHQGLSRTLEESVKEAAVAFHSGSLQHSIIGSGSAVSQVEGSMP